MIVITVNIQIIPQNIVIQVGINIKESANCRIIISAVEVIEACLVIVVITSVTERVISADGIGCRAGDGKYLSPCVVGICDNTVPRGIVDAGNVTLYVGAEKIRLLRHRIADALEIVYAYRLSRGVVDVYQQVSGAPGHPLLVKYAGTRKMIYMLYPVYGLARANPVGIVGIRILSRAVVADYMREPAPLRPCKRAIITGKYIVQRRERPVVGDAAAVQRREYITAYTAAVAVCLRAVKSRAHRRGSRISVGLFALYVARIIVFIHIRPHGLRIVLPGELIQQVIMIPEKRRAVILYLGYISGCVICVGKSLRRNGSRLVIGGNGIFVGHASDTVVRDRSVIRIARLNISVGYILTDAAGTVKLRKAPCNRTRSSETVIRIADITGISVSLDNIAGKRPLCQVIGKIGIEHNGRCRSRFIFVIAGIGLCFQPSFVVIAEIQRRLFQLAVGIVYIVLAKLAATVISEDRDLVRNKIGYFIDIAV